MRAVGLVMVVLLTACTAAASPTAQATVTPTASPSLSSEPTPSPTPDLGAIGAAYLAAVEPANTATCAFNTTVSDMSATLDELKEASGDYAVALRAWADALRGIEWPTELASDADSLVQAVSTEETAAIGLAAASSMADYNARFEDLGTANTAAGAAANLIRGDLGLPSVSVPCS